MISTPTMQMRFLSTCKITNEVAKHKNNANESAKHKNNGRRQKTVISTRTMQMR